MSNKLTNLIVKIQENAKNIIQINSHLFDETVIFFNSLSQKLHGQFEPYCIYQNNNNNLTYALIYVNYNIANFNFSEKIFLHQLKLDIKTIIEQQKKIPLNLNYFQLSIYLLKGNNEQILYVEKVDLKKRNSIT